jgi:hypothetical protein
LRAAYKSWWAKKFIHNFWNVFLERLGSPQTVMHYPQGASDELKETLKGILSGLSTKTEILIPEGVEIKLVEALRTSGQATFHDALTYHNNAIARAILMVALFGAGGYPEFVWQDYGEFEGIEVADTIRLLHAAGIVDMDQSDVNYARSILGLPLRAEGDKEDEVVRPQPLPPPADPNKPPPAAGQGNTQAQSSGKKPGG